MEQTSIIIRPWITEKSMEEATRSQFTFLVLKVASKLQIKDAIEEQFKVDVISVATLIGKGKRARVGKRRVSISLSPFKKAIVRLVKGQKIELFDVKEPSVKASEDKEEKKK